MSEKNKSARIKEIVRKKYGKIAADAPAAGSRPPDREGGCCGPRPETPGRPDKAAPPSCCGSEQPSVSTYYADDVAGIKESYENLPGYDEEADLGLGCGLPTEHAGLAPGQTVVDLGSGAGNDVFIARSLVGENGRVIGIDMTPEMIDKARANAERRGFRNVEFRLGDIEDLPVGDGAADVVVSNCVLNLVPDKRLAFAEIFRILKPGGRFCISDIVLRGELPAKLRDLAELYVGCVAGALQVEEYQGIIRETGFTGIEVKALKRLDVPDDYLGKYLAPEDVTAYRASGSAVLSITVVGTKP